MCILDKPKILGSEYNAHVNEPTSVSSYGSRLMWGCLSLGTGTIRCVGRIGSRAVIDTVDCITKFVVGRFIGSYSPHITVSFVFLARKMKLIAPLLPDFGAEVNPFLEEFAKNEGCKFLVRSYQEIWGSAVIGGIKFTCVAEEMLFRGIVQDVVLKRIPMFVLKKMSPGKESLLETRIYTVARIVLTSSLFALDQLVYSGTLPDSFVQAQVIAALGTGILCGIIAESPLGLLGAIGYHIKNNFLALPCLLDQTSS
jgi:membrane protease YdiL (CAAX protease family)